MRGGAAGVKRIRLSKAICQTESPSSVGACPGSRWRFEPSLLLFGFDSYESISPLRVLVLTLIAPKIKSKDMFRSSLTFLEVHRLLSLTSLSKVRSESPAKLGWMWHRLLGCDTLWRS